MAPNRHKLTGLLHFQNFNDHSFSYGKKDFKCSIKFDMNTFFGIKFISPGNTTSEFSNEPSHIVGLIILLK